MRLNDKAAIFVPDSATSEASSSTDEALGRTTHLAIAAHQDDIEIMAYSAIAECFHHPSRGFSGVVVTDGAGSPRKGAYAQLTDKMMQEIRWLEARKAAIVGEYKALVSLGYPSAEVKRASAAPASSVVSDLAAIIATSRPELILTHNLADKHETHVAVVLRVIEAIRSLPLEDRPRRFLGCEVWRDLDWLADDQKVALRTDERESLALALLGVYDSQITGGKRYDLAALGRRRANATFFASHQTDDAQGLSFALDLTPTIRPVANGSGSDQALVEPEELIRQQIERFQNDVLGVIERLA